MTDKNKIMSTILGEEDGVNEEEAQKRESSLNFLDEKDVFKIVLSQMQSQLVQLKEQEISILKGKALALLEGEEKERVRVSREIHDGIGQMLTAIKLVANFIQGQDELKQELKKMIDDTISEARRVSFDLMPSVLLNFGLVSSVKILCENAEKYAGICVNQSYDESIILTTISFEKSVTLYRLIQEALNNILKHANAKNLIIKIENNMQCIHVLIEDDGVGRAQAAEIEKDRPKNHRSTGLANIRNRLELLNAQLAEDIRLNFVDLHDEQGQAKGTKVVVRMPLMYEL